MKQERDALLEFLEACDRAKDGDETAFDGIESLELDPDDPRDGVKLAEK